MQRMLPARLQEARFERQGEEGHLGLDLQREAGRGAQEEGTERGRD